ncbi:hypothetical protein OUZ56_016269 [Daphnia magna]|uniref:C2H2-type domain-containing protein n=1 Tax=Daphnia magna TaxID=35525 RepID=A0ABR0AQ66_9CRUS|nr:hypothetical protein OUZ56_016269 [Daphnia magna]
MGIWAGNFHRKDHYKYVRNETFSCTVCHTELVYKTHNRGGHKLHEDTPIHTFAGRHLKKFTVERRRELPPRPCPCSFLVRRPRRKLVPH